MHRVNKIVWVLILLAFSTIFGVLLFSRGVLLYLSPRMTDTVYFGLAVLSVLLIYNIASMFAKGHEEKHTVFKLKNLLFVIPVVLFIFTSPDNNTISALPDKNLNLAYTGQTGGFKEDGQGFFSDEEELQNGTAEISDAQSTGKMTPSPEPSYETDQIENRSAALKENDEQEPEESPYEIASVDDMEPCVIVGDTDISEKISSVEGEFREFMYKSLGELSGQEATLYGFVYKDDAFPEGTIAVSRLLITCCAADASLVGFHIKVDDPEKYENDEWILVSGVVLAGSMEYYGQYYEIPVIEGGTVVKCESPQGGQAYIYP